jgi:hypothetical protein
MFDVGLKCRFVPRQKGMHIFSCKESSCELGVTMNYPEMFHGEQLISRYPIPSQGKYYFQVRPRSSTHPEFMLGITTKRNRSEPYS